MIWILMHFLVNMIRLFYFLGGRSINITQKSQERIFTFSAISLVKYAEYFLWKNHWQPLSIISTHVLWFWNKIIVTFNRLTANEADLDPVIWSKNPSSKSLLTLKGLCHVMLKNFWILMLNGYLFFCLTSDGF